MGLDVPFFARGLPRLLHDVFSFYGIVFWIWQVVDAVRPPRAQGYAAAAMRAARWRPSGEKIGEPSADTGETPQG